MLERLVFIFGAGFGRVSVSAPTRGGPYLGLGRKSTLSIFFSESLQKTAVRMCHLFSDPSWTPRAKADRGL